ncbi:hypothetical protein ACFLQK_02725 [bacterium]
MKKKLILLSGPSCVGKGPMRKAMEDLHPDIEFAEPIWMHSRRPRFKRSLRRYEVHGVDYYFFPRTMIEQLDPERFIVGDLGYGLQAIDMGYLENMFETNDVLFTEIYVSFFDPICRWAEKQEKFDIEVRSVFLIPMPFEEIKKKSAETGNPPDQVVYEVMIEKQKGRGEDPPEKMETRARVAWSEMRHAEKYSNVIVCRAGEDDLEQWGRPLGSEAQRVLDEFLKVFED